MKYLIAVFDVLIFFQYTNWRSDGLTHFWTKVNKSPIRKPTFVFYQSQSLRETNTTTKNEMLLKSFYNVTTDQMGDHMLFELSWRVKWVGSEYADIKHWVHGTIWLYLCVNWPMTGITHRPNSYHDNNKKNKRHWLKCRFFSVWQKVFFWQTKSFVCLQKNYSQVWLQRSFRFVILPRKKRYLKYSVSLLRPLKENEFCATNW